MATKKKQQKKKQKGMTLELAGKVFIVDRQPGKKAVREEIDGKVVLQLILAALQKGLVLLENSAMDKDNTNVTEMKELTR